MTSENAIKIVLSSIFIVLLISGCKSTVDKYAVSTCKALETNIAKCSQLIADDISEKNANTLSSVNESEL
tara:strand:+ start:153 stop:362 length:210 start_codon:yes stop_codon:yes gene_type:complete